VPSNEYLEFLFAKESKLPIRKFKQKKSSLIFKSPMFEENFKKLNFQLKKIGHQIQEAKTKFDEDTKKGME